MPYWWTRKQRLLAGASQLLRSHILRASTFACEGTWKLRYEEIEIQRPTQLLYKVNRKQYLI